MNAHLDFALPEDLTDLSDALNGSAWRSVVGELDNILRNWIKHGVPKDYRYPHEALQHVRDELNQAVANCGLDLYEPTFPADRAHPNRVFIDPSASPEEIVKSLDGITPREPNLGDGSGI